MISELEQPSCEPRVSISRMILLVIRGTILEPLRELCKRVGSNMMKPIPLAAVFYVRIRSFQDIELKTVSCSENSVVE